MRLALLFAGVFLLSTPVWGSLVARRIDARDWVPIALGGMAIGAIAVEAALILGAFPGMHRAGSGALIMRCGPLVLPGDVLIRGVSVVGAVVLPAVGLRAWLRSRDEVATLYAAGDVGEHTSFHGVDVVWLPTSEVIAYSVGGSNPQIVVSEGLAEILEPGEVRAVLAHELAHIRHAHGTVLRLLSSLEAAIPPARRATARVRVSLECHADEEATAGDPDSRMSLLDALLKVAGTQPQQTVAAFARESGVIARAEALLTEPRSANRLRRAADRVRLGGAAAFGMAGVALGVAAVRVLLSSLGVCCV